jgi:hypothetical protein
MQLKEYFETKKGFGVLSTADREGRVNAAIFARPHVMDDQTVAFIMPDRLTHANLQSNLHAAYLFLEKEAGYKGVRLHLSKLSEEQDSELLQTLRRKTYPAELDEKEAPRYLVIFRVDKVLPLLSAQECPVK